MTKEKPLFKFFADVGDSIMFGNRVDNVEEKLILNFFADVGETIVFGRRAEPVSLEEQRILNSFARLGDEILVLPKRWLFALVELLESFERFARQVRWALGDLLTPARMLRADVAFKNAVKSGRPDLISSVTKQWFLSPRSIENLGLQLQSLSFSKNPIVQEVADLIFQRVDGWSMYFYDGERYSGEGRGQYGDWEHLPYLEALTETDLEQEVRRALASLKGRDVFFRSESGFAYALELASFPTNSTWSRRRIYDTNLFWIAFCANPLAALRRVRESKELVSAANRAWGFLERRSWPRRYGFENRWQDRQMGYHEVNLLFLPFILPELRAFVAASVKQRLQDMPSRILWEYAPPEGAVGSLLVSNVFAWAVQKREPDVVQRIAELIRSNAFGTRAELSPFIRFVI